MHLERCHGSREIAIMSHNLRSLMDAVRNAESLCQDLSATERHARKACRSVYDEPPTSLPHGSSVKARIVVTLLGFTLTAQAVLRVLFRRTLVRWRLSGRPWTEVELNKELSIGKVREAADKVVADGDMNKKLFSTARLIAEARVTLKVHGLSARGCSSTAEQIIDWLLEMWPQALRGPLFAAYKLELALSPSKRKWARQRLRRIWKLKFLKIQHADPDDPDVQRRKVLEFKRTKLVGSFCFDPRAKKGDCP